MKSALIAEDHAPEDDDHSTAKGKSGSGGGGNAGALANALVALERLHDTAKEWINWAEGLKRGGNQNKGKSAAGAVMDWHPYQSLLAVALDGVVSFYSPAQVPAFPNTHVICFSKNFLVD
jgi:hypothetical protein